MKRTKKAQKISRNGIVFIQASYNNTIVTITDKAGNPVLWNSGGRTQKGARKATAHAAEEAAKAAGIEAVERGMVEVSVVVRGAGNGRDSSVRGVLNSGLKITAITDATPDPHAGCRGKKRRRG